MIEDAAILICTHRESRRLPGKALLAIEGLCPLEQILLRTKDSGIPTYLLMPEGQANNFIFLMKQFQHLSMYEGIGDSPLHRMSALLEALDPRPEFVIRVTHDDPLIDQQTMLDLLDKVRRDGAGYGITPGIVEGAGVEVIRSANLLKAAASREEATEYVSYFVKGKGMPFPGIVRMEPRQAVRRPYRLTLDYPEDALALKVVLREVGATASLDTICRYLDTRPHVLNINRLPDLSFYTCAKDMEKWIGDTILSVLGPNIPNAEYIVVDDGSTDGTLGEVTKFYGDKRLALIVNDRNLGLASSSNIAVGVARGKVMVRVDADDMLIAGSFLEAWPGLKARIASGEHIIYPAYTEVNEFGGMERERVSGSENHHAGCAVMSRAFLNEVRFKDGLRHWDGLELYNRAVKAGPVGYHDEPLWQYRRRPGSMSTDTKERREARAGL